VDGSFQIPETEISFENKVSDFGEALIFTFKGETAGDHGIAGGGTFENRIGNVGHFNYTFTL
jgi:hypothetical protein